MENVNTNSSYLNTMKLAGITLVPVILLFAVGLTPYFSNKEDENRTILTVNQEPVSEAEMLHNVFEFTDRPVKIATQKIHLTFFIQYPPLNVEISFHS